MKRDWMQVGRRPAGICGAGLLIAARLHGFRRTQREIMQVVKIGDVTLRKRLMEFEDTPSGKLTPEEFETIDLEEEADPPAFLAARKRAKGASQKRTEADADADADKEDEVIMDELEKTSKDLEAEMGEAEMGEAEMGEGEREGGDRPLEGGEARTRPGSGSGSAAAEAVSSSSSRANPAPTRKTTDVTAVTAASSGKFDPNAPEDANLSDVDDEEIDQIILTDEESELKSRLWHEMNKVYLEEQEAKRKAIESGLAPKEHKKKKKKKQDKTLPVPAESAIEATKKMLAQKKFSKKINYEVLEGLFNIDDSQFEGKKEQALQAPKELMASLFQEANVGKKDEEVIVGEVPPPALVEEEIDREHPDDYFEEEDEPKPEVEKTAFDELGYKRPAEDDMEAFDDDDD